MTEEDYPRIKAGLYKEFARKGWPKPKIEMMLLLERGLVIRVLGFIPLKGYLYWAQNIEKYKDPEIVTNAFWRKAYADYCRTDEQD